ncbi:hypothetical protein EVAR_79056_1 [Eumeta japonica]|uniref:Uncharacterized protein n=1 Tax=Eumeta variegata TaxID=151549 RepID=A0A4C1XUB2_EUMVA|nr:hypothetical protein EVAR_79056_1 [Eumeta japonica]
MDTSNLRGVASALSVSLMEREWSDRGGSGQPENLVQTQDRGRLRIHMLHLRRWLRLYREFFILQSCIALTANKKVCEGKRQVISGQIVRRCVAPYSSLLITFSTTVRRVNPDRGSQGYALRCSDRASKSRWSPPPMNTCNPSALPAPRLEIEYLGSEKRPNGEGKGVIENGAMEDEWATGALTYHTKRNSGGCYFTHVLCRDREANEHRSYQRVDSHHRGYSQTHRSHRCLAGHLGGNGMSSGGDRVDERGKKGKRATGNLTQLMEYNSESCYVKTVFCGNVIFRQYSRPIFVLQPNPPENSSTSVSNWLEKNCNILDEYKTQMFCGDMKPRSIRLARQNQQN